jgi:Mn2+/Fe2+ NRAMP family transporter
VFLQTWVNIEIGRRSIATGESAYMGFARVWRGLGLTFVLFNFFGWFFPGWARISGTALKALVLGPKHNSPDWLWTLITFAMVAGVLFGPKRVYGAVEKVVSALVMIITLGLIVIAIRVGTWASVKEMFSGLINIGHKEPGFSGKASFIAMVRRRGRDGESLLLVLPPR